MAITDLDEQLLVRAHQAGDEHAFGQIVRSQHRALYAHAYRRLGSHEAAEDAVQDTLLRAYRALPSFDGDLRLRAWLHRILTNVCHDESNKLRRQIGLIDKLEAQPIELAPDPVDEAVLHDTVRIMNSALAELPESYREALVLRYVDGLSFRDVARTIGTTEENARARVHRGRLALHKVLSRVSVMVAFLVPGLRRTQKAIDTGGDTVVTGGGAEHSLSLSTQLASHMVNAAPVLNRVAVEGGSLVAAKTSVVATAVAAVAAVAAPVAAYKVYDTTQSPQAPPPAVASPAKDEPATTTTTVVLSSPVTAGIAGPGGGTTSSTSTSSTAPTTSTIPLSALVPFAPAERDDEATTTTTTPPTTTAPPAEPEPTTTVHATVGGDTFAVSGTRPDFTVSGGSVLQGDGGEPHGGRLDGDVYVADAVGGDASAELTLTLDDGRVLRVRFRGTLQTEEATDTATRWTLTGAYSIDGAGDVGIAERGTATVVFQHVDGAPSSLRFDLQGQQAQQT